MAYRDSEGCLTIAATCFAALLAVFSYQWYNGTWLGQTTVSRPRDLGVQYQKVQQARTARAKPQPAGEPVVTAEATDPADGDAAETEPTEVPK
jgi:hypothetical protein